MSNRPSSLQIALIGYGAIGRYVADQVAGWPDVSLGAIVMRKARVPEIRIEVGERVTVTDSVATLPGDIGLVVECAGHEGLKAHGADVLRAGTDLLVVSVGALADPELLKGLRDAAAAGGARLKIAPGAIGGVDAISAAREGGLDQVRYTSRKPPKAWKGTQAEQICDLDALSEETVLLSGRADEAARTYPQNANVAATLALAAGGFDKVAVRLVADPHADGNIHEIEAAGSFGRMSVTMRGKPLPENPKTSSLTAYSVLRAIRNAGGAMEI